MVTNLRVQILIYIDEILKRLLFNEACSLGPLNCGRLTMQCDLEKNCKREKAKNTIKKSKYNQNKET